MQIRFICVPQQSVLVDTLQIFSFRIMFAVQEFGLNQHQVQANVTKKMAGLTIASNNKTPDTLIPVLLNLSLKPSIVYWLCCALNAQCKGLVVNADHAKVLVPYLVKSITDTAYSGIEELTAMMSLLGNLMIRFPGIFTITIFK